ncbi:MAG: sigma-70 family RNA polymerase sigma factor [Armatimonadota bacterium]|nr:sigma-70 family RNA polymerase sigma factor [Armatimonadota bacterium]MDR7454244.1 sigma-70 family RNA polymerase sigma factor [Armatimonadota bacterium]MDR7457486.1 sigma-70 family RNA polymerase sigma factor [Armatimonadota bacterium]MDR7497160.1 sigma-70 family RNA polymerase sigma factor [Armatimonadota bacterium]MDR7513015.1 sigma-70 family RNA polymerase sigma factor [Armatimonadota bacterium]
MPDDESTLIARARRGDLDAFDALVRAHQDRVYHLAYRVTGNHEDAADAAQDAFVRAYQALPRFRGDAAFATWLHRIATNAALDLIRRRPAQPPIELPPQTVAPGGPEHEAGRREVARRVGAALARLPAEFRAAVVLRDLQGFDYEEIARILQVPVGTVRSRISRGREALRAHLADLVRSEG